MLAKTFAYLQWDSQGQYSYTQGQLNDITVLPNDTLGLSLVTFEITHITFTVFYVSVEIISTITTDVYESLLCFPESVDVVRTYFNYTYPYFFAFVTYNTTSAIFLAVFQILFILCWHFVDIVIIVLSIAMSDHYKMFNETLYSVKDRVRWQSALSFSFCTWITLLLIYAFRR